MAVRLVAVPEIRTRSAWVAAIPKRVTTTAAAKAAGRALSDARKVRRFVVYRFKGTVPPPPWPQHRALIEARRKMRIIYDGMTAVAKRAPNAIIQPKYRAGLVREGVALYRETNVLLSKFLKLPKIPDDPSDLIPDFVGPFLASMPWYIWAGVAYVVMKKKSKR